MQISVKHPKTICASLSYQTTALKFILKYIFAKNYDDADGLASKAIRLPKYEIKKRVEYTLASLKSCSFFAIIEHDSKSKR
jgi:hypothetical protein